MPTNAEQTNERDELIEVVARTYPGWNEDTEDGDLTSHWEKVNAECRRQAAEIVDAILTAGWRPPFVQPLGEVQIAVEGDAGKLINQLRSNADAHHESKGTERRRAADLIESQQQRIRDLETQLDDPRYRGVNQFAIITGLRERLAAREATIARVREIHRKDAEFESLSVCNECMEPLPCSTLQALDASPEKGGQD